ncbi:EAL domain-containing protein [Shimia biformata]|uniref:EAL domain-containing protein n=1 Tax=Shimia biformata TaxID=1294299 RepID=UPI00194E99E2|nr:EAL domain-containing protein [Shimia biformata]
MARRKYRMGRPKSDPLSEAVDVRDASTLDMVKEAITHKQVRLAYQPVIAAHDLKTRAFYEGLIRVLDETGRIIPAKDFMPQVGATETGRDLDCLALELGLAELARNPGLRLSINMSGRSIGYGRWMQTMHRGLKRNADLGQRLILEISEASVIDLPELVRDFMDQLHPHGIAFALDEFAAGLTSLHHFRDFYFDIIKLDGRFSRAVATDGENQILASAVAQVARAFDIYSVASRVETPQDAEMLKSLGFDCLQGFMFGAPSIQPPNIQTGKKAASDRSAA